MASERITENLILEEMKMRIGENQGFFVYPQGDTTEYSKINLILRTIGGKPDLCEVNDYNTEKKGISRPEFVVTFKNDQKTIIVIECKRNQKDHVSDKMNKPKAFAVDGVLFYAKHLKSEYNVISLAVSGTSIEKMRVSTFYWAQNSDNFVEFRKARDILLEPENYLKLIQGQKMQKEYSLDNIRESALMMHDSLRIIKVSEKHKPIFIAGILIALQDEDFKREYDKLTSVNSVINALKLAISNVLNDSDIKRNKIENIKNAFSIIGNNEKLKQIPLGQYNSITWYIEVLEMKIFPMMNSADSTIDALGVFYHEFVKYSGGDGKGLGIVLTPQHLTDFMCEVAEINVNSKVIDICCGSGSFLVTAMGKMLKEANESQIMQIKQEQLYGVELDIELYTLAVTNMIIRKDGKSNIYHDDCFNSKLVRELKSLNLDVGLMNPPYSQKDKEELEFVENLLDILSPRGVGVVVVPMSCAIGTRFRETRRRLFNKHTLKAVFSMPDDIFYPTGTNVCVMVWEAHKKHNPHHKTFFGYCKEDGFEKRKKLGRIDVKGRWQDIKNDWLDLYRDKKVVPGLSALKEVDHHDEWLAEAYMETDYSKLTIEDFEQTTRDYLSYLVKAGKVDDR